MSFSRLMLASTGPELHWTAQLAVGPGSSI
jgi:hypothetical protein